jgi:hypothetical protein
MLVFLFAFTSCYFEASAATQENLLLVSMVSESPKEAIPGIYSYDNDSGKFALLIPYGEYAKWAPDHKKFAYMKNGILLLYDITKREKYHSDCDLLNHEYWWMPKSDRIAFQNSGTTANDQFGIAYRYIGSDYHSIDIWNKTKFQVGKITFSSDANSIAFETVMPIVGWGKIPNKLFVADMPFTSLQDAVRNEGIGELSNIIEINPNTNDARYLVNPLWQPDGKFIAYDVISDTRREVWLFDSTNHLSSLLSVNEFLTPETKSVNAITAASGSRYTNKNMRVLGWSADGSMLAVATQMDNSRNDNGPVLIIDFTHKEIYYGSSLIQSGYIGGACFSKDNKMFATLRVPNPENKIGSRDEYHILIRDIATDKSEKILQFPRGLHPLDIDW